MSSLEAEREMTRAEVAAYLREFADRLDGSATGTGESSSGTEANTSGRSSVTGTEDEARTPESQRGTDGNAASTTSTTNAADSQESGTGAGSEKVTLVVGNESATVNPPEAMDFAVEVSGNDPVFGAGRQGVEFGLYWRADEVEEDDELSIQ
ncbi:amphi-Trp domain-containing protein [Halomarina ordinaria]|uniref:Amphi-Trp domain-containing protein n=1 Tax=Halomarina ordinaria TaxID=3033939 RepID=A0ABD5U3D5_9EURY|nr:amphi-Trp domain-containing protein [Halomarina sp. PSRA2]